MKFTQLCKKHNIKATYEPFYNLGILVKVNNKPYVSKEWVGVEATDEIARKIHLEYAKKNKTSKTVKLTTQKWKGMVNDVLTTYPVDNQIEMNFNKNNNINMKKTEIKPDSYKLNRNEWAKKYSVCSAIFNALFDDQFLFKLNNGSVVCGYRGQITEAYAKKIHAIYSNSRCKDIRGRRIALRDKTQNNIFNLMIGLQEELPSSLLVERTKIIDNVKKIRTQKLINHEMKSALVHENYTLKSDPVIISKIDSSKSELLFDDVLNAKNVIKIYINKMEKEYDEITKQEMFLQDKISDYQKSIADIEIEMIKLSEMKKIIIKKLEEIKF